MPADLHCHTTASDGSLTPRQLVELAKQKGLTAVGITDHDTVNGVREAESAGIQLGVEIVPGVELNTDYDGVEVHVLGYYPDLDSPILESTLKELRNARESRIKLIIAKLAAIGLPIKEERVLKIADGGSVGRPHIAQAMQEKGYIKTVKEAFAHYIGPGCPAYVPRFKLTPQQGIEIIRKAKGVAVLAHPGLVDRDELIPHLLKSGLKGMEVYHTDHSKEMEHKYAELAEKLGLIITGGSDFHGPGRKEDIDLGDRLAPESSIKELKRVKEEME